MRGRGGGRGGWAARYFPRAGEPPREPGAGEGCALRSFLKKPPVFSSSLPPESARQPRPGCRAGWRRAAPQGWALSLSSRGAPSPPRLRPSSRLLAPRPATAAGMGCFCAVPEEFYCEVLLLDESKLTLTTQQQGIKVRVSAGRG